MGSFNAADLPLARDPQGDLAESRGWVAQAVATENRGAGVVLAAERARVGVALDISSLPGTQLLSSRVRLFNLGIILGFSVGLGVGVDVGERGCMEREPWEEVIAHKKCVRVCYACRKGGLWVQVAMLLHGCVHRNIHGALLCAWREFVAACLRMFSDVREGQKSPRCKRAQ